MTTPISVITRHPDFPNDIHVIPPGTVRVVNIDFGGAFDITHTGVEDAPEIFEWAVSLRDEVADLPPTHQARLLVHTAIREACQAADIHYEVDQ